MSSDGIEIKKKVLLYSLHRIESRIYVVIEIIEVQRSVSFEFCLYDEFIEFW